MISCLSYSLGYYIYNSIVNTVFCSINSYYTTINSNMVILDIIHLVGQIDTVTYPIYI